jgi:hypothetical protein
MKKYRTVPESNATHACCSASPSKTTCHPEQSAAKSKDLHSAGSAANVPGKLHQNNLSFFVSRRPAFPTPKQLVISTEAKRSGETCFSSGSTT